MFTEVEMRTMDVFTVKVALVSPAGTNTMEGTLAAPPLLERMTVAPPAGAGALSVTVPVEDCTPPITVLGFSVSEERVTDGEELGDPSKSMTAGFGSLNETATNVDAEIM